MGGVPTRILHAVGVIIRLSMRLHRRVGRFHELGRLVNFFHIWWNHSDLLSAPDARDFASRCFIFFSMDDVAAWMCCQYPSCVNS